MDHMNCCSTFDVMKCLTGMNNCFVTMKLIIGLYACAKTKIRERKRRPKHINVACINEKYIDIGCFKEIC